MSDARARSLVHLERERLADDLQSFGPDAPTILDGWDAADLLEHLLLRERRPDLLVGTHAPLPPVARWAEGERAKLRDLDWRAQVERFREGSPVLSTVRRVDELVNTAEYAVHHEDLLRARPGWSPRALGAEADRELWSVVRRSARILVRAEVDVTLVSPLGGVRVPSRGAAGSVRVHGDPMELLLWAFGRDRVARVDVQGPAEAVRALNRGSRGF